MLHGVQPGQRKVFEITGLSKALAFDDEDAS